MGDQIYLVSINVANCLGLLLMAVVLITNSWRIRRNDTEGKFLVLIAVLTAISCFADMACFTHDGKPGAHSYLIVYLCNFWLFASGIMVCYAWFKFLAAHLDITINKVNAWLIRILLGGLSALLVINIFYPCVFSVSGSNTYSREPLYWVFLVVQVFLMADSVFIYIVERRKNGILKQFPVWLFVAPAFGGAVVQSMFYGISVTWACIAISTAAIMASLQNELLFRDNLTGLFNRHYLEVLKHEARKKSNTNMGAIMMDLNGFKSINDTYGHSVGDEALVATASILRSSVGDRGLIIRYAGDEFIAILNTDHSDDVKQASEEIAKGFDEYNAKSNLPYQLSASIGYSMINLRTQSVDELLNEIDKRMYESKVAFYANNPNTDRRSRRR